MDAFSRHATAVQAWLRRPLRAAHLLSACLVLVGLAACASITRPLPEAADILPPAGATPPPYLIQPGDILETRFIIDPTLNQQSVVTPGGRVSFRYASDLLAAGLTLPEVRSQVIRTAGITEHGFDLVLRSSVGTRVYVTGEVNTPGEIIVNGNITALQAVSRAGGFKLTAQKSQTVLLRRNKLDQPALYGVNLEAASDGDAPQDDVELRTYDVLYVPRDRAGNLSLVFERIRQAIPFNFSLIYGNSAASLFR